MTRRHAVTPARFPDSYTPNRYRELKPSPKSPAAEGLRRRGLMASRECRCRILDQNRRTRSSVPYGMSAPRLIPQHARI